MANPISFSRRKFISAMSGSSLALGITASIHALGNMLPDESISDDSNPDIPEIIDTNINLFQWPFRRMKYGETKSLITKLRLHRITKAWAGNFEALFSKSINDVNQRLVEECRN